MNRSNDETMEAERKKRGARREGQAQLKELERKYRESSLSDWTRRRGCMTGQKVGLAHGIGLPRPPNEAFGRVQVQLTWGSLD